MRKTRMSVSKHRSIIEWLLMILVFFLTVVLVIIHLYPYKIIEISEQYPRIHLVSVGVFLCLLAALMSMIKVCYSYVIASKTARSESAKRYFDRRYNTDEHNTFLEKRTRKDLAYKDDHKENISRQHRRWGLWIILILAISLSLLLSIFCKSFPLFLFLGLIEIVIFMYADYFPANKQYYEDYGKVQNVIIGRKPSLEESKAIFYQEEYRETELDIRNEKYKNCYRNLFTIKEDILSYNYRMNVINNDEREKQKTSPSQITNVHTIQAYFYRIFEFLKEMLPDNESLMPYIEKEDKYMEDKKSFEYPDLHFRAIEIRQIYKMCFDRIRNGQLVVNIVLTLLLVVVIGLDLSSYSSFLNKYFMLPEMMRFLLTIISIIGVFVASIAQILRMPKIERIIAEVSYKSRYVVDERLNDLLVEDIIDKRNIIKPIDIARGIYQTQGYVMTTDKDGKVSNRVRILKWYDRPLFHHQELSNRRRLVITVYLLMGSAIAVIWQLGKWFLLPVIIVLAIITHLLLQKHLLPILGKDKLKRDIEKLNTKKRD